MTSRAASLLSTAQAEFSLTAPDEIFRESEAGGDHTAARLFSHNPSKYSAIVGLSAEGVGVLRIAALLACSPHTVMAVQRREGAAIAQQRHDLAERFRIGARIAAEAAIDMIADPAQRRKMSALQLATAAAIMTDKAEILGGGQAQTIRIEVEHRASVEEYADLVQRAAARMDSGGRRRPANGGPVTIETGAVEVGPAPGSQQADIDSVVAGGASDSGAMPIDADACADARPGLAGGGSGATADEAPAGADGGGGGRVSEGGVRL